MVDPVSIAGELAIFALEEYMGVSAAELLPEVLGGFDVVESIGNGANELLSFAERGLGEVVNVYKKGKKVVDAFKDGARITKGVFNTAKGLFSRHHADPGDKRTREMSSSEEQLQDRSSKRFKHMHSRGARGEALYPRHEPSETIAPFHPPVKKTTHDAQQRIKSGAEMIPFALGEGETFDSAVERHKKNAGLVHHGELTGDYDSVAYGQPYSNIATAVRSFTGMPMSGHPIGMGGAPSLADIHGMAGAFVLPQGGVMEDQMGPLEDGFSQKNLIY